MQLGPGPHRPVSARQAFPPVYFAMVMATGIVSIAVYLNGMQRLAATLMWLNVVLFIAFWILLIGRLALAPRGLLEELTSFKLAPRFFTIVAGTSVLARQLPRNWQAHLGRLPHALHSPKSEARQNPAKSKDEARGTRH
jgi:tellurite resistance protein TehA-like permease